MQNFNFSGATPEPPLAGKGGKGVQGKEDFRWDTKVFTMRPLDNAPFDL